MFSILKQKILRHIRNNKFLYSALIVALALGCFAGGMTASSSVEVSDGLFIDMTIFFSAYSLVGANRLAVFTVAALNNILVIFFIFLCGFFLITTPLIIIRVGFAGFAIGFATAFFTNTYGAAGAVIASIVVWLPSLLFLPVVFYCGMLAVRSAKKKLYIKHVKDFLFFAALAVICGGVEAFVVPVLLRSATGLVL